MRIFGLVLVLLAGFWAAGAQACNVPNPNLIAPPFIDGCNVPASSLNKLLGTNPAFTGPTSWTGTYGNFDPIRISVNNFPASSEYANAQLPFLNVPNAIVAAINVPSTATSNPGSAGFAVNGYALTSSAQMGAVAIGGFAGVGVAGGSDWGANFGVTNAPAFIYVPNTGFSNVTLRGIEININLAKASGAAPTGMAVRGIDIVGASETNVGAGSSSGGVLVEPLDGPGGTKPWQAGFGTSDNAANVAMSIGALGTPGGFSGGQPISWNSYNGNSVPIGSTIGTLAPGTFQYNAAAGGHLFQVAGTSYASIGSGAMVLLPLTSANNANSLPIIYNALNNTGSTVNASMQLIGNTTDLRLFSGNLVSLQTGTPAVTAIQACLSTVSLGQTGMCLLVNNNGGTVLAPVTLGASDSGGSGKRALVVPD